MQFLIFLSPRFLLALLVGVIALYTEWFVQHFLFIMLAVCVIAFLAYFIAEILERKRRKPE